MCRAADGVSAVDAVGAAGAAEPRQAVGWVARIPAPMPLPAAPTFWATEASTSKLPRRPALKVGGLLPVPGGALSLFAVVPRRGLPQSGVVPVLPVPGTLLTVPGEPARGLLPGAVQLVALLSFLQPLLKLLFSPAGLLLLGQLGRRSLLLLPEIRVGFEEKNLLPGRTSGYAITISFYR